MNWIIDKFRIKFRLILIQEKNITVDEFIILFKGRNSMKLYMPLKPIKWVFKVNCFVDYETIYLYNLFFKLIEIQNKIATFGGGGDCAQNVILFFMLGD